MILSVESFLSWFETKIVWGIPLVVLILSVGIILTFRLRFLQVAKLGLSLKYMVAKDDKDSKEKGEVSSFAALCVSMAATLGTGKIIGVATAICCGGPGALFWMIIAAMFGMATKYAEGFLAVKFRKVTENGDVTGGPFAYIEDGMGKKWKWMAKLFAIFACFAGVAGIGTMTQMNSITESFVRVFDPNQTNTVLLFGKNISIWVIIVGTIITILAAISVIGGIKRISSLSIILVPFMAIGYFLVCILVVLLNIDKIPMAFSKIIESAFSFKAGTGAITGIGIIIALQQGVSKGIFSNEAGLGSAPIAMASAKTENSVHSGLVCMSGTFIDTMVLCLTVGLGIVITGTYENYEGIDIAIKTFEQGIHINNFASSIIVMLSITTFAFTTIIGWNVYGEKCIAYLSHENKKWITFYRILYIATVAIAPYLTLHLIWTIASIANGLMAIPNLIALMALSGLVAKETNDYFKKTKAMKNKKSLQTKYKYSFNKS